MRTFWVLALAVFVSSSALANDAPNATSLVMQKAIDALGGEAQIDSVKTLSLGFDDARTGRKKGLKSKTHALIDLSAGKSRVETTSKRSTYIEIRTQALSVSIEEGKVEPSPNTRFAAAGRFTSMGKLLVEAKRQKSAVESIAQKDKSRSRILITRPSGEMFQLDIDNESGRLLRYEGRAPTGSVPLVVEFDSWKLFGAFLLPEKITFLQEGSVVERELKVARVNGPVSPLFFEVPDLLKKTSIDL